MRAFLIYYLEVVTDMKDASNALRWCVGEMERRYKLMSALGVRNIKGYNDKLKMAAADGHLIHDPLWKPGDSMDQEAPLLEKSPYIVVIVDEFADLIMVVVGEGWRTDCTLGTKKRVQLVFTWFCNSASISYRYYRPD